LGAWVLINGTWYEGRERRRSEPDVLTCILYQPVFRAAVIRFFGGKALGHALAPLNTSDFAAQLLQAQASGAQVIGLANSGADTANSVKQAFEFGLAARIPSLRSCRSSPISARWGCKRRRARS
jgi:hypothetical protein